MKSNFFLIAFLLISSFCYSQEYEISGKVTEAQTGLPLPGATVVVKNGTLQTIADLDGNFQISGVPSGATLVFSYVGFTKYEFKVTKNETITVTLNPDAESLEEVVVIGYGSQTKREAA